jgi:hypothetical protein
MSGEVPLDPPEKWREQMEWQSVETHTPFAAAMALAPATSVTWKPTEAGARPLDVRGCTVNGTDVSGTKVAMNAEHKPD